MNVRLCGLVADFVGNFVAVLDDVVLSSCGDSNSHAAEDEKEEPDGEHNDAVTDRVAAALAAAEEEAKDGDDDDEDGEAIEEDGHEFGSGVQITHRFRVFQVVEDSRIRSEHAEDEHDDAAEQHNEGEESDAVHGSFSFVKTHFILFIINLQSSSAQTQN